MKRSIGLVVPAVLSLLLAAVAPVGARSGPACFGVMPTLLGTEGDNVIQGTPGDDVIVGMGGNDIVYGGGGRDRICGGAGDDRIYGGPDGDLLDGEGGNDRVYGQAGNDGYLLGGDGNDVLSPGAGTMDYTASIEGGAGRDRIVIDQGGYNEIFGGAGRDTVDLRQAPLAMIIDLKWGEYRSDTAVPTIGGRAWEVEDSYGSEFADHLWGSAKANRLYGYGGDDVIHGRLGDDTLDGGSGADQLFGGAGDDFLSGGPHVGDWLEGEAGFDTCVDPDGWIVCDTCEA